MQIDAIGQLSCATMAFSADGTLHVALIVKATFALQAGAPMTLTRPWPIVQNDVTITAGGSLVHPSDLAPSLWRVDVWLVGHVHRPPGQPRVSTPQLLIMGARGPLLCKSLLVQWPDPDTYCIPLVYERAPKDELNPVGVDPAVGQPQIISAQSSALAGFGPLSRQWPTRRALLGRANQGLLEERLPKLGKGFDWRYFQCAPEDQRLDELSGDEWLILSGLKPGGGSYETQLPGAVARARVYGEAPELRDGYPLNLHLDSLGIHLDEDIATLTWRQSFPIADESLLATSRFLVGLELPGKPIDWEGGVVVGADTLAGSTRDPLESSPSSASDTAPNSQATALMQQPVGVESLPFVKGARPVAPSPISEMGTPGRTGTLEAKSAEAVANVALPLTPQKRASQQPPPTSATKVVHGARSPATRSVSGDSGPIRVTPFSGKHAPPPRAVDPNQPNRGTGTLDGDGPVAPQPEPHPQRPAVPAAAVQTQPSGNGIDALFRMPSREASGKGKAPAPMRGLETRSDDGERVPSLPFIPGLTRLPPSSPPVSSRSSGTIPNPQELTPASGAPSSGDDSRSIGDLGAEFLAAIDDD